MATRKPLKILVVDDEEIVRHTLEEFFKYLGHHAVGVEDGLSGLRALENGRYDAAIVDIRMPGLDGISFLSRSRTMWPDLPIIIVTGHGSDETREEAMQAGAFAFLAKPFRFDEIKDLMTKIDPSQAP